MSLQAYPDATEATIGRTPQQAVDGSTRLRLVRVAARPDGSVPA